MILFILPTSFLTYLQLEFQISCELDVFIGSKPPPVYFVQWHESRSRPGSWNKGLAVDRLQDSPLHGSSEVWDGSENISAPDQNSSTKGEENGIASPEKEFTSFTRNMPSRAKMGVDLLQNGEKYRELPHVSIVNNKVCLMLCNSIYGLFSIAVVTKLEL